MSLEVTRVAKINGEHMRICSSHITAADSPVTPKGQDGEIVIHAIVTDVGGAYYVLSLALDSIRMSEYGRNISPSAPC